MNLPEAVDGSRFLNHAGNDGVVDVGVGVVVNRGTTGGLAEYHDSRNITAECCNVVSDPFDCETLI